MMVMFCTQVDVLPQSSVAVQVRWIFPSQGISPVVTSAKEMVGVVPQLSVAVAVPQNWGLVFVLQFLTVEGGHWMIGGTISIVCT